MRPSVAPPVARRATRGNAQLSRRSFVHYRRLRIIQTNSILELVRDAVKYARGREVSVGKYHS